MPQDIIFFLISLNGYSLALYFIFLMIYSYHLSFFECTEKTFKNTQCPLWFYSCIEQYHFSCFLPLTSCFYYSSSQRDNCSDSRFLYGINHFYGIISLKRRKVYAQIPPFFWDSKNDRKK